MLKRIIRAFKIVRWKWEHRAETLCRQKRKRMLHEIYDIEQRDINLSRG